MGSFGGVLIIQIVWYMLKIFVGGGLLKRLSIKAKVVESEGQEKVTFSQVLSFFVDFVIFSCNVVGQVFDNVGFVIDIEKYIGHLELPVLNLDQDGRWIFEQSFDDRIR